MRTLLLCLGVMMLGVGSLGFAAEEGNKEKLTLGFVYVSPVGDVGFSYSHDVARKQLEAEDSNIKTYLVESVKAGADAERVILNMARKKYDIIISTSFGFMDSTLKVAEQYPNTIFLHCSGYKSSANMSNYFGRMYQARYLSGMVAGGMTKSNIIGYVAAFPIPEVIRGINAFTLGVQAVNPDAEVRVVWTKTWFDPVTEKEAGKSLCDIGADVLAQHQDSPGVQEAAKEKKIYSVGYNSDMSIYAPESHLTAAVWNWYPFYKDVIEKARKNEWKPGSYWPGIETGIVGLSPFGAMVPKELQDKVMAKKQEIVEGTFVVFKGPVADQSGAEKITADQTPSDKELFEMNWFVKGVVGSPQ